MEKDRNTGYQPSVERLLTYGESKWITPDEWPDYREVGIGPEQLPELIQMATDEALNGASAERNEVWTPQRAWCALGQLCAIEAVEPLLELFDEDPVMEQGERDGAAIEKSATEKAQDPV